MIHLLKLAAGALLSPYNIADSELCRQFLHNLASRVKPLVTESRTKIDDELLKHVEFILNNEALFRYVHRLISEQLQTEEILLESADETILAELVENTAPGNTEATGAINLVEIVSIIGKIVSMINAIKNR
jgi:hypothetical protein